MRTYDDRRCALGEGPLWHPERGQLFWFDILGKRLMSREGGRPLEWQFDEHVSAAGWIDRDTLLIASETAILRFEIGAGKSDLLAPLEADNPGTRSNDGRADPWGGFWIGTMGKNAEPGAGAIYRFWRGRIEPLFDALTIPNAICFSPDRRHAYFTDTVSHRIMRQPLDGEGWPQGAAETFVDLSAEGLNPDGAVVDAEGCLWNAQWGASRVARYSPQGGFLSAIGAPASQTSCPAFGGADMAQLFVTTATQGLGSARSDDGRVLTVATTTRGQREHAVKPD